MRNCCEATICEAHAREAIHAIWHDLGDDRPYRSIGADAPDFHIHHDADKPLIIVLPQAVRITRTAFVATLNYLIEHGHDQRHPYRITLHEDPHLAGPLCRAARDGNNGIDAIPYILPVLADCRMLGMDLPGPEQVWLTHAFLNSPPGRR